MKTKTNAVEEIMMISGRSEADHQGMLQSWQGKFYAEKKVVAIRHLLY